MLKQIFWNAFFYRQLDKSSPEDCTKKKAKSYQVLSTATALDTREAQYRFSGKNNHTVLVVREGQSHSTCCVGNASDFKSSSCLGRMFALARLCRNVWVASWWLALGRSTIGQPTTRLCGNKSESTRKLWGPRDRNELVTERTRAHTDETSFDSATVFFLLQMALNKKKEEDKEREKRFALYGWRKNPSSSSSGWKRRKKKLPKLRASTTQAICLAWRCTSFMENPRPHPCAGQRKE